MTILDEINDVKREEVKKLKRNFTLSRFSDSEFFSRKRLSFLHAINRADRISIIAEIKKASPSKGIIKNDFNHLDIAKIYMDNEAEAISILTDINFFKGSITFLNDIAKIKRVPLLRKDFIIDEYQIYEAKSNGADVVLLIAESLSSMQMKELISVAIENDLEVLLELHSIDQVKKINFNLETVIGINNRDLKTFNVDLVSESGIKTLKDINFIKKTRTRAILVGEHLMASQNIKSSLKELKTWCRIEN